MVHPQAWPICGSANYKLCSKENKIDRYSFKGSNSAIFIFVFSNGEDSFREEWKPILSLKSRSLFSSSYITSVLVVVSVLANVNFMLKVFV